MNIDIHVVLITLAYNFGQLTETYDKESLQLVGERVTWYRPLTLAELLALKVKYPDAILVRGNTGLGKLHEVNTVQTGEC